MHYKVFIYLVFFLFASIYSHSLAFPFGVDFPDETGKMSRSDKRGTLRGESGFYEQSE